MRAAVVGLALVCGACESTYHDVHLLSGFVDPQEPAPVMAVHVLLLERSQKEELVGLLKGDGLAHWFNPEPADAWDRMQKDARVQGHLEDITFDAAVAEHVAHLPILERRDLWVCVLAHPSYKIEKESEWEHFHIEMPAPPSGDDIYFGLNKHEVKYLKEKEDRRNWREKWEESRTGENRMREDRSEEHQTGVE